MTRKNTILAFVSITTLAAATLFAGPLSPPPGPVASTGKTLAEAEPRIAINATNTPGDANSKFRIAQPGSYYLTANITGDNAKHGIEIAASGVTIDLAGFVLAGGPGTLKGITTDGARSGLSIRNGTVTLWGDDGVNIVAGGPSSSSMFENVFAIANGNYGIRAGSGAIISSCSAESNGFMGVSCDDRATISYCTLRLNSGVGLYVANTSVVLGCTSMSNAAYGFSVGDGCSVQNSVASLNGSTGINASNACTISNCTSSENTGDGISASRGSTISHSSAYSNALNGIEVNLRCVILENVCEENGTTLGGGIHAFADHNRIEGNTCIGNDLGINVSGTHNIIIRNMCHGNVTNWELASNNMFGPIVDLTAATAAGVTGDSAPASINSTHAHANFTY